MLPVAKIDLQFMAFWDVSLYTLVKNMTFGGEKNPNLLFCDNSFLSADENAFG